MPIWLAVLAAVGVPLLVALVTTPVLLHVIGRPKVRFAGEPAAYWSIIQGKDQSEWIYCLVDVYLINDGNEETHVLRAPAQFQGSAEPKTFEFELITPLDDGGLMARNGGAWQQRLVYRRSKPPAYKPKPHLDPVDRFFPNFRLKGTISIFPSQHRRLLWGATFISAEITGKYENSKDLAELLIAEQVDPNILT
jgi:hypothetical protein